MHIQDNLPLAVRTLEHVWIPLPDGLRLAARIWLPETADHHPVPAVLEYIPYRRRTPRGRAMMPCMATSPVMATSA